VNPELTQRTEVRQNMKTGSGTITTARNLALFTPIVLLTASKKLLLLLLIATFVAAQALAQQIKPDETKRIELNQAYGKLPLSFEANQGQTDPKVKFLSRGNGYSLFLAPTEAVLVLTKTADDNNAYPGVILPSEAIDQQKTPRSSSPATVLRMKLVGGKGHRQNYRYR